MSANHQQILNGEMALSGGLTARVLMSCS